MEIEEKADKAKDKKTNEDGSEKRTGNVIELSVKQRWLREIFLPVKNLPFLYPISSSLVNLDNVIKTHNKKRETMMETIVKKDGNGRIINYKCKPGDGPLIHDLDKNGELIPVGDEYVGRFSPFYNTLEPNYIEEDLKWQKQILSVDIFPIKRSDVKKYMNNGKLDGIDLTPLFDFFIM